MATAARQGYAAAGAAVVLLAIGVATAVAVDAALGSRADVLAELTRAESELTDERSERDPATAWVARVLLVLAVAWIVIGMLSARTSLVRRPGAAATRASWIGSTRPWRARESTLGMLPLDRWLMILVPAALLVATRAAQTSFFGVVHLAVVLGAWLVFAAVVRLLLWRRSPWPVIAAVGGVVMVRCALTLAGLSSTGPSGFRLAFGTDAALRSAYLTLAVALSLWAFVAAGWALSSQLGPRRAVGTVVAAVGTALALPAAIIGAVGADAALLLWNDELGLLPAGFVDLLEIPWGIGWWLAAFGAVLALVGLALALPRRAGSVGARA